MRRTEAEIDQEAATAFAHFLVGMMKADGHMSLAEEEKVADLLYNYKDVIPGQTYAIQRQVGSIKQEPRYTAWNAHQHLEEGFLAFDRFVEEGGVSLGYMLVLRELMRLLMEVDGIDQGEIAFMQKMESEIIRRYNSPRT